MNWPRAAPHVCALVLVAGWGGGCSRPEAAGDITVAAAANLTGAFAEIGQRFTRETGIRVVYSFAATTVLARQIENAAPFDVFASADTDQVDTLVRSGKLAPGSRAVYARGQLALWVPQPERIRIREWKDLAGPQVRYVSVASPSVAPYGQAAVDALRAAGLWEAVKPKIVYGNNISQAKQLAASGNADAALTAYSLVFREPGMVLPVDGKLHQPLDQALGILTESKKQRAARQFTAFVLGPEGRSILSRYGYRFP